MLNHLAHLIEVMHHHPTKSIEPQVRYARPANKGMYDPIMIQVARKYCQMIK